MDKNLINQQSIKSFAVSAEELRNISTSTLAGSGILAYIIAAIIIPQRPDGV